MHPDIDVSRLVDTFIELVKIDSPSGHEETISAHLAQTLRDMGAQVRVDAIGNIVATFPGTREADPIMLNAHMDTVGTDVGITPVIRDGVIYSDGTTILGADDKSGVAIILEVMRTLLAHPEVPRPPVEVVITVGEEQGLVGAQALDTTQLKARRGIVLDSGGPIGTIILAAPYQDKHRIVVLGKASHAGAAPEKGINAIRVAAEAIAAMRLGKVDEETTANVGVIQGGTATNIVPDRVEILSEARSRNEEKLIIQTDHMLACFREAAQRHGAQVEIESKRIYNGYCHTEDTDVVRWVTRAVEMLGFSPIYKAAGGGTDANVFNNRGIPAVVITTGQADVHTPNEHIAIEDMANSARWVLTAVQLAAT